MDDHGGGGSCLEEALCLTGLLGESGHRAERLREQKECGDKESEKLVQEADKRC